MQIGRDLGKHHCGAHIRWRRRCFGCMLSRQVLFRAAMSPNSAVIGSLLASCLVVGCVLPTDKSDEIVVTIEAPSTIVVRGTSVPLIGRMSRRTTEGSLVFVHGAEIFWHSSDPATATVVGSSDGSAIVTGLQTGTVEIQARAAAFADAEPGTVTVRVANAVEIDSVVPALVRYGDQVTVYGVGLGNLARLALGEADLIPDETTFEGERSGLGRLDFWVPYPATSARAAAATLQGATALAPTPTTVVPTDLYHELGAAPPRIDISGPPVRSPDTLFYNPALALTVGEKSDGFRFALQRPERAVTITISTLTPAITLFDPVVSLGAQPIEIPPSEDGGDPSLWTVGLGGQVCSRLPPCVPGCISAGLFIPFTRPVPRTGPVTVVRALKDLPASDLLLGVVGDPPGRYSLTIEEGYKTADPRIAADRFEENDHCVGADLNSRKDDTRIALPFADTLTIDNPYEVDWLRFTTPGEPGDGSISFLTVRAAARPFAAADSSDLGLLLLDDFGVIEEVHTPGSAEMLNAELNPGDYYLIVLDEAGVATRYSVCIAVGSDCQFLPGSED
jgi:hypothetical protein